MLELKAHSLTKAILRNENNMNYSDIIKTLNNATGFDLFRIRAAIDKMLEDPKYMIEVKNCLRKGQEIEYFEPTINKLVKAIIKEFKRTKVLVENIEDQQSWFIPFYYINLHAIDADIIVSRNNKNGLERNEVKVGDTVGFRDGNNNELYGEVTRLNQKSVTINCRGTKWRVAYVFLFKVLAPAIDVLPEHIDE